MEVKARAPGKIILAGEHAVVHGSTAVAASLNLYTYVSLRFPTPSGTHTHNLCGSLFVAIYLLWLFCFGCLWCGVLLNWHKDGRFGPELNWVLVEMVIRGYPFKLLWFCDVCVLYYVAVKKLGLIAYFLLVYFGFNFLIGIYPFEHCVFCVCVLLCLGFVILWFGLNWVLLNCFVCGKCSLMPAPGSNLYNFLSLSTNSTNFF